MDYSDWAPRDVRALISAGKLQGQTSGMCAGYAQANLCILPKAQAFDFLLFCMRNPRPCSGCTLSHRSWYFGYRRCR